MNEQQFNDWLATKGFKGDFGLRPGETKQAWQVRVSSLRGGVKDQLNGLFADPDFAKNFGSSTTNSTNTPNANPNYTAQIQDFYRMMTDPNAPELKAAGAQGVNMGQRAFGNAGIRGGLSDAGIAKAGMDSRGALFNQRAGLGLQALQTGSNREMGLGASGLARDEFNRESLNQQYNKDQATQQALVSAGGQIIKSGMDLYKSSGSGSGGGLQQTSYTNPGSGGPEGYGTSQPSDWENPYGGGY